jgi:hypothetical protein
MPSFWRERRTPMAEIVYLLCAITSITCALLLYQGYRRTRTRLLFWSGLCFVGLAANNVLLFIDLVIAPDIDLSIPRSVAALTGMLALIFGLVWESRAL